MSPVLDPLSAHTDVSFSGGRTDSVTEFSTMVSRLYSPVSVQAEKPDKFHGKIRSRPLGDVYLNEVKTTQHLIELAGAPASSTKNAHRFIKVSLLLHGHGTSLKGSTQAEFGPGEMIIHDSSQPYTMYLDDDFHMVFLLIPRNRFDLPESATDDILGQSIDCDSGISRTVAPFFAALAQNMSSLSGPSAVRLMSNTVDLVETMMFSMVAHPIDEPHRDRRKDLLLRLQA